MIEKKTPVHEMPFEMAWGDMDALEHMNNARYFDYFQEARIRWLASIQLDMKQNTGPVVLQIACTYLKPIIYPASLILKSSLHSLGRTSMVMDHDLYQNDQLMAQGTCKIVWIDYLLNKSIPFPDKIRELIC